MYDKMRRKISFILGLLILCFMGCSSKESERIEEDTGKDWSEKTTFVMSARGSETEKGIILNGGDRYLYYDENAKVLTPLCGKADCEHTSDDTCAARLLMNQSTGVIGYYDGQLWFFWEHEGEVILRQADVDGTNQKDLFSVDIGLSGTAECRIYKGVLYLLDEKIDFTVDPTGKSTSRIAAIDLKTGEVKGISEETENMLWLRGMDGNRLYYSDYRNEQGQWMGSVYCYDCDTGETTRISLPEVGLSYTAVGDGYLVYQISEAGKENYYIIDPETGEEFVSLKDQKMGIGIPFEDQFLIRFEDKDYYRFEVAERIETRIHNPRADEYNLVWPVKGGYLVRVVEDNYVTDQYAFLSENALLNGREAELLELGGSR